jgi:hypothetical protein
MIEAHRARKNHDHLNSSLFTLFRKYRHGDIFEAHFCLAKMLFL